MCKLCHTCIHSHSQCIGLEDQLPLLREAQCLLSGQMLAEWPGCASIPDNQTDLGTVRSVVHSCSCACLASKLAYQEASPRREGEEHFLQLAGTMSPAREAIMASIGAVIVRPPFKPRSSSIRLRFISTSSTLSRSDSCRRALVCTLHQNSSFTTPQESLEEIVCTLARGGCARNMLIVWPISVEHGGRPRATASSRKGEVCVLWARQMMEVR